MILQFSILTLKTEREKEIDRKNQKQMFESSILIWTASKIEGQCNKLDHSWPP